MLINRKVSAHESKSVSPNPKKTAKLLNFYADVSWALYKAHTTCIRWTSRSKVQCSFQSSVIVSHTTQFRLITVQEKHIILHSTIQ